MNILLEINKLFTIINMILANNIIHFDNIKSDTHPDIKLVLEKCEFTLVNYNEKYANLVENNFYICPSINVNKQCDSKIKNNCYELSTNNKYYRYDTTTDKYILPVPIYPQKPEFFYLWEVFRVCECGIKTEKPLDILVVDNTINILYCIQEYRRKFTKGNINDLNQLLYEGDIRGKELFVRHNFVKSMPNNQSDLVICWNCKFIYDSLLNVKINGTFILNLDNASPDLVNSLAHYFSKVTCYIPECAESKRNFMIIICYKLIKPIGDGIVTDINLPSLDKLIQDKNDLTNLAIQKIKELDGLFSVLNTKTKLLYLFHVRNKQIKFAEDWCKKFKMEIHPFYAMKEAEPILVNKSIDFSKLFPLKEGVDRNKLRITDIGLYSVTPYTEAEQMVDIIAKYVDKPLNQLVITESNGGLGGNTLAFAKRFKSVNVAEYSDLHCDILRWNISAYGYDNIKLYCSSYLDVFEQLEQNILFIDAVWFGPGYKYVKKLQLYIGEFLIEDVINIIKDKITLLVLKIPFNFDMDFFKKKVTFKNMFVHKIKNYQMLIVKF